MLETWKLFFNWHDSCSKFHLSQSSMTPKQNLTSRFFPKASAHLKVYFKSSKLLQRKNIFYKHGLAFGLVLYVLFHILFVWVWPNSKYFSVHWLVESCFKPKLHNKNWSFLRGSLLLWVWETQVDDCKNVVIQVVSIYKFSPHFSWFRTMEYVRRYKSFLFMIWFWF